MRELIFFRVWIRLGEHNIETVKDCNPIQGICAPPVQDVAIDDVIIHPDYAPNSYKNDIALIRLSDSANFSYGKFIYHCNTTSLLK